MPITILKVEAIDVRIRITTSGILIKVVVTGALDMNEDFEWSNRLP